MIVKTFEGLTMADVIGRIKKEFGREAVILETKERPVAGGRAKMVEVKAAVAQQPARKAGALKGHEKLANSLDSTSLAALGDEVSYLRETVARVAAQQVTYENLQPIFTGLRELKLLLMQRPQPTSGVDVPEHLRSIVETLTLAGLEAVDQAPFIDILSSKTFPKGPAALEQIRAFAMKAMMERVRISPPILASSGHQSIHLFVGPTGCGKTSTLIKVAASLKEVDPHRICLACFDPGRLGQWSELRLQAKVYGFKFELFEHYRDLEAYLGKDSSLDYLFIDSRGALARRSDDLDGLLGLTKQQQPIDVHLVLSITEKSLHLDRAVASFSPLGLSSLILTKMDEGYLFGDLYALSHRWSLPLSYFGTGPEIPADLERASRERVIERIFGV